MHPQPGFGSLWRTQQETPTCLAQDRHVWVQREYAGLRRRDRAAARRCRRSRRRHRRRRAQAQPAGSARRVSVRASLATAKRANDAVVVSGSTWMPASSRS